MASIYPKKDRSVKDMLTKLAAGKMEAAKPGTGKLREEETDEDTGVPITRSFLEGLFALLRDDIQAMKRDVSQDLKVVRQDFEEVGESVATLEEHEKSRGEEIEQLQEITRLQDQQIELQAHAKGLENGSRRNRIRMWRAPTGAEDEDILAHQILGESSIRKVCRVGPPRPFHVPPADILACIHDFPMNERIQVC
ncbi:hypothetical protein NDU88_006641 [Pleurodeles waltl]|uniref:Uncharacterized protein n=1 Tax=Pleurodeles waltl TaxID=8319 RepID=A0AAV7X240_PLEWA|nr:hypothetical protein NDU88_006641 [Pleurodeles waltl]